MRYIALILIILVSLDCTANDRKSAEVSGDILVSKENFLDFPFYKEIDELDLITAEDKCSSEECNEVIFSEKVYYRAVLLNEKNYSNYLIGRWSGGDCVGDQWSMDVNGKFSSHYPRDGDIYRWSGKYFFKDKTYIEDGTNNEGRKEWNEAYLYYIPVNDLLIYKGVRSFDSFNKDGSLKYIHYDGPNYYYFRRCGEPQQTTQKDK